jgi:hypothetical protein
MWKPHWPERRIVVYCRGQEGV